MPRSPAIFRASGDALTRVPPEAAARPRGAGAVGRSESAAAARRAAEASAVDWAGEDEGGAAAALAGAASSLALMKALEIGGRCFARIEDHGQTGAEGDFAAFLEQELVHDAAIEGLHFHRGLVGFDVGDGAGRCPRCRLP